MAAFDALFYGLAESMVSTLSGTCSLRLTDKATGYDYLAGASAQAPVVEWADVPCTPPYPYETKFVNGTTIRDSDFQLLVPAKGLDARTPPCTPVAGMFVKRDGRWFGIVSVKPLNSGGQNVVYILQCR